MVSELGPAVLWTHLGSSTQILTPAEFRNNMSSLPSLCEETYVKFGLLSLSTFIISKYKEGHEIL